MKHKEKRGKHRDFLKQALETQNAGGPEDAVVQGRALRVQHYVGWGQE